MPGELKIKGQIKDFVPALKTVQRAVNSKSSHEILKGIKFKAGEEMTLTATDLDKEISRKVPAEIIDTGLVVIPVRVVELFNKMPNGAFEMESKGDTVTIKYGKSNTTLNCFSGDEFPEMEKTGDDIGEVEITAETLKEALTSVSYAASKDASRPVFNGVLFKFTIAALTLVATDTHRLARFRIDLPGIVGDAEVIVPKETVDETLRILGEGNVKLTFTYLFVSFECGDLLVKTRVIDGKYPNFEQVIPEVFQSVVRINAAKFKEAAERASLLIKEAVRCEFTKDALFLSSRSETGMVNEIVPLQNEGINMNIYFNVLYLIDVLKSAGDDEVVFKLTGKLSAAVIIPTGDEDRQLSLMLPVRLREDEEERAA